jgi:cephalosporin hydroxylase
LLDFASNVNINSFLATGPLQGMSMTEFEKEVQLRLQELVRDKSLSKTAAQFLEHSVASRYSYNWFWLGRPIIQYPQDICAIQELIWRIRPDAIIETGIAHGGSLMLSASLLAILDLCDAASSGEMLDPAKSKRKVIGVDIDIRPHNRAAIEAHPMSNRITMIQGSSIDPAIMDQVKAAAAGAKTVLVCLDSNHTHDHVLAELQNYAPMVSVGSYCVVFDTLIENMPKDMYPDRPWGPGDNAMTAVDAYLKEQPGFEIDEQIDAKLQISVAPRGYLKRVR